MSSLVKQSGDIYQKDVGQKRAQMAGALTECNRGAGWKIVEGIP